MIKRLSLIIKIIFLPGTDNCNIIVRTGKTTGWPFALMTTRCRRNIWLLGDSRRRPSCCCLTRENVHPVNRSSGVVGRTAGRKTNACPLKNKRPFLRTRHEASKAFTANDENRWPLDDEHFNKSFFLYKWLVGKISGDNFYGLFYSFPLLQHAHRSPARSVSLFRPRTLTLYRRPTRDSALNNKLRAH